MGSYFIPLKQCGFANFHRIVSTSEIQSFCGLEGQLSLPCSVSHQWHFCPDNLKVMALRSLKFKSHPSLATNPSIPSHWAKDLLSAWNQPQENVVLFIDWSTWTSTLESWETLLTWSFPSCVWNKFIWPRGSYWLFFNLSCILQETGKKLQIIKCQLQFILTLSMS